MQKVLEEWLSMDDLVASAGMGKIVDLVEDKTTALETNRDILVPVLKWAGLWAAKR